MGYVFISYSTKNQLQADSMKDLLNRNGIATWMAPYDILPGSSHNDVIPNAIRNSTCVILMLSNAAQNSPHVSRETDRAINFRRTIIPIKIEDVQLNDKFQYYTCESQIISVQQIDENQPIINTLLKTIKNIASIENDSNKENICFQENKIEFLENKLNVITNRLNMLLNLFEPIKFEKEFKTALLELNSILHEYKEAFRLAKQEDIDQISSTFQNICHELYSIKEKSLDDNIATKAGQITDLYNTYVEKYNAFVKELNKGYSDESNKRALEAETAFHELEEIVASFI